MRTVNPQVPGSSPGRGARLNKGFAAMRALFYFRLCAVIVPQSKFPITSACFAICAGAISSIENLAELKFCMLDISYTESL